MALFDELGFAEAKPDDDVKNVEHSLIPAGRYPAMLIGFDDSKESKTSGSKGDEFEFQITHGKFEGMTVKDTIWASDNVKSKSRKRIFAHRLGIVKKVGEGKEATYAPIQGKDSFRDALGAEVIIDVIEEEYTNEKTGKKGTVNKLAFEGIFTFDDPKVKDVPKPPKDKKKPSIQAPKPKDRFDDI